MSTQEKKAAVPAEGTVIKTPEKVPMKQKIKNWADNHPKTVKWVKRIGVGLGWAASIGLAWMAGKGGTQDELMTETMLPEPEKEVAKEEDE